MASSSAWWGDLAEFFSSTGDELESVRCLARHTSVVVRSCIAEAQQATAARPPSANQAVSAVDTARAACERFAAVARSDELRRRADLMSGTAHLIAAIAAHRGNVINFEEENVAVKEAKAAFELLSRCRAGEKAELDIVAESGRRLLCLFAIAPWLGKTAADVRDSVVRIDFDAVALRKDGLDGIAAKAAWYLRRSDPMPVYNWVGEVFKPGTRLADVLLSQSLKDEQQSAQNAVFQFIVVAAHAASKHVRQLMAPKPVDEDDVEGAAAMRPCSEDHRRLWDSLICRQDPRMP
jgi:hypothetical protein